MLQRVMLDGIKLPRLYIAENAADVAIAKDKGIPFVRWTQGNDALIKMLLRPTLEKMFPYIKWSRVLGPKKKFRTRVEIYKHEESDYEGKLDELVEVEEPVTEDDEVIESSVIDELAEVEEPVTEDDEVIEEYADKTSGTRLFRDEHKKPMIVTEKLSIQDYIGDMNSYVNIDVLQRLKLMPQFIGDILDCIKVNVTSGVYWNEGYNKKRGCAIGNFNRSGQLPNLIILDVSGSIPRGISATMISLIDTLRSQLTADLIITSSKSKFYKMGEELPDPDTIRSMFGYGNESHDFFAILSKYVKDKHYGHVFSFGDNDTPDYSRFMDYPNKYSLTGAKVEHVHHYHTGRTWVSGHDGKNKQLRTGYAKWCHLLSNEPQVEYDQTWCEIIYDN